jgi:hypothetical protein
MDGFIWADICILSVAGNCTGIYLVSGLKTITYKQISTGTKRDDVMSKTGPEWGNKDYESAALTIELRAQTVYLIDVTAFIRLSNMLIVTILCTH